MLFAACIYIKVMCGSLVELKFWIVHWPHSGHVINFLTLAFWVKFSGDDLMKYFFFILPRKQDLTFQQIVSLYT